MIGRIALGGAVALALGACATAQPPATGGGAAPARTCNGSSIQQFVGQARSSALEQQMLQASGAAFVRWVPFGTAATMEFRADRLTVFLDSNNRVERISCS
jgi:phage baseplate assembly protein W